MTMKKLYMISSILFFTIAVNGCTAKFERWIDEKLTPKPVQSLDEYIVNQNDNLYTIAWLYGINYIQLAEWNQITGPDYVIHPGQRLVLKKPKTLINSSPEIRRHKPTKKTTPKTKCSVKTSIAISKLKWEWPIQKISNPIMYRGGIKLKGKPNQEIYVIADGVVVYSGFDLKHYEGLIIIKHKGDIFSAYGFVDKIVVKKGMKVSANQVIAYLPAERKNINLYFDMRHCEKRLDPLKYLPKV